MAGPVKAPGMKGGMRGRPMPGQGAKKGTLKRLLKMLFTQNVNFF
jgi:hypothetical protein